jgi:CubicO group peptidase (beta-lactamase class C family)
MRGSNARGMRVSGTSARLPSSCSAGQATPTAVRAHAVGFLLALALAPAAVAAPAWTGQDHAFADRSVAEVVERYDLPGIAVGVVVDGEVVYRATRGELLVGSGARIDADTLFKIASNTKAMTAALLARLVDQGKLRWDDPVVKHLPGFAMHDPWVTREIQVRDLLIHNSGLGPGAGDLMLWPEPNLFTRQDVIRGLRYLKPAYSFRSRYAYDNTLYIVAGEVAAAAGGAPYDALVRRELFEPLGLTRCQAGAWQRDAVGNVAQPHAQREGGNVPTRVDGDIVPDVPMMAAGGIRCSLDDMLTWARMWLQPQRHGLQGGQPWLSQAQREEVWKAHTPMPLTARMRDWDRSHYSAYGYGWRLTDVDDTWKVSHTGTLGGMYSALVLLPEKNAGFVILINGDADAARTVLTQVLVKHFTDPRSAPAVAGYAQRLEAEQAQQRSAAPLADTSSRVVAGERELGANAGVYRDPWFGEASVCSVQGRWVFRAAKSPKMLGDVMRAGQRLLVQWRNADVDEEPWIAFEPARGAQPARMSMIRIDPDGDFSSDYQDLAFERIRDCP